MLENSFIFLDGIGHARERSIWRSGIWTWEEFLDAEDMRGIPTKVKAAANERLGTAIEHLDRRDGSYFSRLLGASEQWRCYDSFSERAMYLDIETTGLSRHAPITVVGIYDGRRTHALVRGQNLDSGNLSGLLASASMIVTFNGASFDLPMIRQSFPEALPEVPHLDLKHLLRRLGHTGGLKAIERRMGLERDLRLQYLTGQDAVYLWRLWERRGRYNALEVLKEYNREDCENLKTIADRACTEMKARLIGSMRPPEKIE